MPEAVAAEEIGRLALAEEVARILHHRRAGDHVRVSVTTAEETEALQATLRRRRAEVTRVPVGREVEQAPPIRQEGDTIVVPVLEERVVLVRTLVLTEEIHFRLATEEEDVSLSVPVLRQRVAVERHPAPAGAAPLVLGEFAASPPQPGAPPPMMRTLTALFDSRTEAERAAEALRGLNVHATGVHVHAGDSASFGDMLPDDDRASYHEGLRRGGAVVMAQVEDHDIDLAMDAMEAAGAVDLDTREQEWRSQGWSGASSSMSSSSGAVLGASSDGTGMGTAAMLGGTPDGTPGNPPGTMLSRGVDQVAGTNISGAHPEHGAQLGTDGSARLGSAHMATGAHHAATGREEAIPIAEERLRVGKREARAGRVRVRSYVVETPIEEQVTLREERVHVERRAADSPGIADAADLFRERVIEATESVEEAVVQKDVRITGEVVVNKEVTERTETIRDSVRRTEVEVDEDAVANDARRRDGKGVA